MTRANLNFSFRCLSPLSIHTSNGLSSQGKMMRLLVVDFVWDHFFVARRNREHQILEAMQFGRGGQ